MSVNTSKRNQSSKGRRSGPYPPPKPGRKGSREETAAELVDAFLIDAQAVSRQVQARLHKVNRRTWWLLLISFASFVLIWAVVMLFQHWQSTRGPVLLDALQGPYNLEARPLPALDADLTTLLPGVVGAYTLLTDVQADPGQLGTCLQQAGTEGALCEVTYHPVNLTMGQYQAVANAPPVTVVVAQFYDEAQSAQAMAELIQYSRATGRVGNYTLRRVRPVDYYYSTSKGVYTFTWSKGVYVYVVSGASMTDVDAFVKNFPY